MTFTAQRPRLRWPPPWSSVRKLLVWVLAILAVVMAGWSGFLLSERYGTAALRDESNHRLDLFASAVGGMVKRLEQVPATIQLNKDVQALLLQPRHALRVSEVNHYLRRLNAHLGSLAVYVLDERGVVVASSNSELADDSLLGEDVAFRPYFQEALAGQVGRHFAIGVHSGVPGYFVSHPIRDGARVLGVATIKISLDPIEEAWDRLGAPALLADVNQVVILSSRPEWRYTALAEPSLDRKVDLQLTRLYNNRDITRFPLPVKLSVDGFPLPVRIAMDEDSQVLEGVSAGSGGSEAERETLRPIRTSTLVLGRTLDGMDWRLMIFSDLRGVRNQAVVHSMLSAVAAGFVLLLALFINQRRRITRQKLEAKQLLERINQELEHKVARRTRVLSETNVRLRKEIAEREQAEQTLRAAQDELVHAAKMAVLGQLATGITHELTQPLGAIRTLSGNAIEFMRRGDQKAVASNLQIVTRLADQMGGIIQPLKGFARKSQAIPAPTDVAHAMSNALFLYSQRVRKDGVMVHNLCEPGEWVAWCDPNRLEQVLINLIGNALDAMREQPVKVLTLQARRLSPTEESAAGATPICIEVLDTGSGVPESVRQRLFEPFFTTKEAGVGLGLGLAISRDIVREFHGELEAHNRPEGGACFTLRLPEPPPVSTSSPPPPSFSVDESCP